MSATLRSRTLVLFGLILVSLAAAYGLFQRLFVFSLHNEFSSHILLMPLMSFALIWRMRDDVFADVDAAPLVAGILAVGGIGILGWAGPNLSLGALGIVLLWIGTFLLCYGITSFRKALFPLLMLVFMVPIPQALLNTLIFALQQGSAEATDFLFRVTGTPFYREGFGFVLPRINIEIATQCSGIRSSLAVLISSLLAGHLLLRSPSRKLVLVAVAVPLMMFKNGVRIAVLSLLAIHVDKRWLTGSDLHRDGGILFFTLALVMLWPVLWVLRRGERKITAETLRRR